MAVLAMDMVGLLALARLLPFQEAAGRHNATALAQGVAEGRFSGHRLGPGVDGAGTDILVLGPCGVSPNYSGPPW